MKHISDKHITLMKTRSMCVYAYLFALNSHIYLIINSMVALIVNFFVFCFHLIFYMCIWTNASCQVWCYLNAEDHWSHNIHQAFVSSIKWDCEEVVLLMTLYMTHLEFNYLKFMGTLSCCNEHVFMCQYVYILLCFCQR